MKNKKSIMVLLLVAIIGVVGLTLAYFTNTTTIENEFSTNPYGTTYTEQFVSPTNWTPGTKTDKTLIVTNSGSVDEAVRVEYTENWTSKNGDPLPLKQDNNDVALINWTNIRQWTPKTENNKNYIYYNYKLAPTESTSTLLDSVTFNSAITNNSNCVTDTSVPGQKTVTCSSSGDGYDGATYKLTFKVETVQYDKYKEAWGTSVDILGSVPVMGTQYLTSNATNSMSAEYGDDTKTKMFTFTHGEGADAVTESRYIGNDPKNYVIFNCDIDGTNCELWRIIGVFNVERPDPENEGQTITEQRMKIVRNYAFTNTMAWNSNNNNVWEYSTIKLFLNDDYLNRTGNASTYGLKALANAMIDDAKFYLGGKDAGGPTPLYGTTEEMYAWERGNALCGACGNNTNWLTWTGKVGLMYPSDVYMVYGNGVNDTCFGNPNACVNDNAQTGWVINSNIKQGQSTIDYTWLLSPISNSTNTTFRSSTNGGLVSYSVTMATSAIRPVVYLKSDVIISSGTGSIDDPYVLK